MNERERFLHWVSGKPVDRPLRWEWSFRRDTTVLWRQQGLLPQVPDQLNWCTFFALDRGAPFVPEETVNTSVGIDLDMLPLFDDEMLSEDEDSVTMRDGWRTVARHGKTASASIPQYLSFGVQSRADFLAFKQRWDPLTPARYPADWEERKAPWQARDYPLRIHMNGWYGLLRKLMGVEELSVALYDQEPLIEEIAEFWGDFLIQALDRATAEVDVDYVLFWEDLAFKTSSLLSPAHFRRFFLPHYQRVIDFFRGRGIGHFMVDSDGNIESIIPLWLEAGIDIIGPFEVAAGMDVAKIGRAYPQLTMIGGIDKVEIARGPEAIEAELQRRILPCLQRGRYIPTLDHATIPELSLRDYTYYRNLVHDMHRLA